MCRLEQLSLNLVSKHVQTCAAESQHDIKRCAGLFFFSLDMVSKDVQGFFFSLDMVSQDVQTCATESEDGVTKCAELCC